MKCQPFTLFLSLILLIAGPLGLQDAAGQEWQIPSNLCGKEATSVRLIALRTIDTDRAIIFVHGLAGDPCSSFRREGADSSWPEMMANDSRKGPDDIASLSSHSLYTVDYRPVFQGASSVDEAAQQFENVLLNTPVSDGQTILQRYNHVWIIAHSLGGLIVKRALVHMARQQENIALSRIAGVILLGVPSNGAPLAALDKGLVSKVAKYYIGDNYTVIKDLDPDNAASFLTAMETEWETFVIGHEHKLLVFCGYERNPERLPLGIEITIVPQLFAKTRCSEIAQPFSDTHINLPKPFDNNSEVYLWVRSRIFAGSRERQKIRSYTWNPANSSLGQYIQEVRSAAGKIEESTSVKEIPETIEFAEPANEGIAGKLHVSQDEYFGATIADLLENVARRNNCVSAQISTSRRSVVISIDRDLTKECKSRNQAWLFCTDLNC